MKKVQIVSGAQQTGPRHLAAVESTLLHGLPALVGHLCVTRYDDGEPRKPGWVTINTQGAIWKAVAKDPDAGASLLATGQSVDDALALLELLLGSEDAPWELDPYLSQQKGRGRKSA